MRAKASNRKWLKIMAISLSYPSTILGFAWALHWLEEKGYITSFWGNIILVLGITHSLFLMVYYAYKKKN